MAQLAFVSCHLQAFSNQLTNQSRSSAIQCSSVQNRFGSPKSGTVGAKRLEEGALPGTYWSKSVELGEEVKITFNKGSEMVSCTGRIGENLLKIAEKCGVMIPSSDFCFEGSCYHCEMQVTGGATEVGSAGSANMDEVIRSCLCPVPAGRKHIEVNLVNEDDVWGEQVV